MTIVEAHVAPEKQDLLKQAFRKQMLTRPPALKQLLLVQSSSDPTLWRSLGFWPSREAFEEYRSSDKVSAAYVVFRSAGSEPTVSVFDIVDQQAWS